MAPYLKEFLAANILHSIIVNRIRDSELQEQLFARLIPETLTVGLLAFNLACFYSQAGDKQRLLTYADIALDKGFGRRNFQLEQDFLPYRKDIDFIRLINKSR